MKDVYVRQDSYYQINVALYFSVAPNAKKIVKHIDHIDMLETFERHGNEIKAFTYYQHPMGVGMDERLLNVDILRLALKDGWIEKMSKRKFHQLWDKFELIAQIELRERNEEKELENI